MKVYNPSDTVVIRQGRSFPSRERVDVKPDDREVAQHLLDVGRLILIEENSPAPSEATPPEQPKRGGKKRVRDTGSYTGTPTNESEA